MHAARRGTTTWWKVVGFALVLCAMPAPPAHAQDSLASTTTTTVEHEERDGGGFPWGLLGLLGLAGLLGRRKTEEVHTHRETVRPVETHRATTSGPVVDHTVVRPDDTPGGLGRGGTTGGGNRTP
jgi:MYXO-CTERM domain-containing protein